MSKLMFMKLERRVLFCRFLKKKNFELVDVEYVKEGGTILS